MEWTLQPGQSLSRRERGQLFGGALYGGIEPSAKSPNVFLYSDPRAGKKFGYDYDGWVSGESLFLYTGEGAEGHQEFREGNLAVETHVDRDRALRLFVSAGTVAGTNEKIQRYVGEFRLASERPYVRAEAPDRTGLMRSVIVFRLRPVGDVFRRPDDGSAYADVVDQSEAVSEPFVSSNPPDLLVGSTALEVVGTTEYGVSERAAGVARRREAELVQRFQSHLEQQGHQTERFKVRPRGELRFLYTDLYDRTQNVLYEAKAAATREAIRMAIGQLFDYVRNIPNNPQPAVLLPGSPTNDLLALLRGLDIACVCEMDARFETVIEIPRRSA